MLHEISSPESYRAVYKGLRGFFTGLSLVTLGEIQENEYSPLDTAIEAAKRFWAGILCNTRDKFFNVNLLMCEFLQY